jgi:hypothetical protein
MFFTVIQARFTAVKVAERPRLLRDFENASMSKWVRLRNFRGTQKIVSVRAKSFFVHSWLRSYLYTSGPSGNAGNIFS